MKSMPLSAVVVMFLVALMGSDIVSAQTITREISDACSRPHRKAENDARAQYGQFDVRRPSEIDSLEALRRYREGQQRWADLKTTYANCLRRYGFPERDELVVSLRNVAQDYLQEVEEASRLIASAESKSASPQQQGASSSQFGDRASGLSSTCPETLAHLAARLPNFPDPDLQEVRAAVVRINIQEVLRSASAQGFTPQRALAAALEQADVAERGMPTAERCLRELSSNPSNVAQQLRDGTYPMRVDGSVSSLCAKGYVLAYWQALTNRETAIAMACAIRKSGR